MSRINLPWQRGINWFRYAKGEGEERERRGTRFAFDKYLLSRLDLLFFSKHYKFDEREREKKEKERRKGIKKRREKERGRQKKVKFFKNGI